MSPPFINMAINPGGDGYQRVSGVIIGGLVLIGTIALVAYFLPPVAASIIVGIIISAATSAIILIATPRAAQIAVMGMALGISADAGYAQFTDKTPVTIANALVSLARAVLEGLGVIVKELNVPLSTVLGYGVWTFIFSTIVFMGLSFLIKHDG